jgi:hypothetical protein
MNVALNSRLSAQMRLVNGENKRLFWIEFRKDVMEHYCIDEDEDVIANWIEHFVKDVWELHGSVLEPLPDEVWDSDSIVSTGTDV